MGERGWPHNTDGGLRSVRYLDGASAMRRAWRDRRFRQDRQDRQHWQSWQDRVLLAGWYVFLLSLKCNLRDDYA